MMKNNTVFLQMSNAYKVKTVKNVQNFVLGASKVCPKKIALI